MINVVFPLHNSTEAYWKYEAVAIYSMLRCTHASIHIHIVHDETVGKDIEQRLHSLIDFSQNKMTFYEVNAADFLALSVPTGKYTVGTLFRLMIPRLLADIDKVIYLDADLVIDIDIKELWNIDMQGYKIAACINPWVVAGKERGSYFNAGVMVMDLEQIRREHNLMVEAMQYFRENPNTRFADQDALNDIFGRETIFLPEIYNTFTKTLRNTAWTKCPRIYHFAADKVNIGAMEHFDRMFLEYLCLLDQGEQANVFQSIFQCIIGKNDQLSACVMLAEKLVSLKSKGRYIFFGATGIVYATFCTKFPNILSQVAYLVDNSVSLQGKSVDGKMIFPPKRLQYENTNYCCIIVLSANHYADIKQQLEGYGLHENDVFFDGRILFGYWWEKRLFCL